jgi:endonuclease YncB( thermonuclease family)
MVVTRLSVYTIYMPSKKDSSLELTKDLSELISTIRSELETGKTNAKKAMEEEIKTTYWNVGKLIKTHISKNTTFTNYGNKVFTTLVGELNIDQATLYSCVKFYEQYPKNLCARINLTWTHIRALLSIQDTETRKTVEKKIIKENLSTRELKTFIQKELTKPKSQTITVSQTSKKTYPALPLKRDVPYYYKSKTIQNVQMIDLGFNVFCAQPHASLASKGPTHYTYKAFVDEIIDGDTLWLTIDLGFNMWTKQKVRLRGIDTAHIDSLEGQKAKLYIETQLKDCTFVMVKTYWRDKFSRYLADIFYDKTLTDPIKLAEKGRFLNQDLLDEALAVLY